MKLTVCVHDPSVRDPLSKVRGVGRYLQILKENFPGWKFVNNIAIQQYNNSVFINPFFNFLQKPLTLKRIAKKQLAVIHDLIPLKYPRHFPAGIKGNLNIFLNKFALKNYDLIITDSHASKNDILRILRIKEDKVKVIYPTLPKIFLTPPKAGDNQPKTDNRLPANYCLYVGDATWNKNLVNLAKAIKLANVTCVFVGKVFADETRKLVNSQSKNNKWIGEYKNFLREVEGDERFIFLGFAPDKKLLELYKSANCNILVSREEGFGFSYLEAASQGCPSVVANISVFREITKNKGALFVKNDSPENIAKSISEVYFNQELKSKLGREALLRSRFFSQGKFKSEFNKIVNF